MRGAGWRGPARSRWAWPTSWSHWKICGPGPSGSRMNSPRTPRSQFRRRGERLAPTSRWRSRPNPIGNKKNRPGCPNPRIFAKASAPSKSVAPAIGLRRDRRIAVTETYEHVLFDVADGLATITLNRPDKLNAWTPTMEAEVRHATRLADGDAQIRAIIITCAGRGFCAGADLSPSSGTARPLPAPPPGAHRFHSFRQISKPLVAAINGPAAGL